MINQQQVISLLTSISSTKKSINHSKNCHTIFYYIIFLLPNCCISKFMNSLHLTSPYPSSAALVTFLQALASLIFTPIHASCYRCKALPKENLKLIYQLLCIPPLTPSTRFLPPPNPINEVDTPH